MHGRQKKETTAEEENVKKKEQIKKVNLYQHAMGLIFSKRAKRELDEELLKITGQVLSSNPDIGTLWNIRKEVLATLKESDYAKFCDETLQRELDFSEFCLKTNPKSYGAWHHRYWLMKQTKFSKVASELKLLGKYLEYDDRNFHCWDYRRFLRDNCPEITMEQELEFTTEKISSNFSNFSSWHLRSKILPRLARDYLDEELELIRNAVFTDPKDQSAWFYHRWLLRSQLDSEHPRLIGAQHSASTLTLIFNYKTPPPTEVGVQVVLLETPVPYTSWVNPWSNKCSKLWQCNIPDGETVSIQGDKDVLSLFCSSEISLDAGEIKRNFPSHFDVETETKSEKLTNLLKDEIVWVKELQELEPYIKWPVSTLIMLMRMVDFIGYKSEILKHIDTLMKLDTKRMNFYLDLRSKYLIEWKLIECSNGTGLIESALDLSDLNLTALYYPERMSFYTNINLHNNALKNCEPFRALLNCKNLDVFGNKLTEAELKRAITKIKDLKI